MQKRFPAAGESHISNALRVSILGARLSEDKHDNLRRNHSEEYGYRIDGCVCYWRLIPFDCETNSASHYPSKQLRFSKIRFKWKCLPYSEKALWYSIRICFRDFMNANRAADNEMTRCNTIASLQKIPKNWSDGARNRSICPIWIPSLQESLTFWSDAHAIRLWYANSSSHYQCIYPKFRNLMASKRKSVSDTGR